MDRPEAGEADASWIPIPCSKNTLQSHRRIQERLLRIGEKRVFHKTVGGSIGSGKEFRELSGKEFRPLSYFYTIIGIGGNLFARMV